MITCQLLYFTCQNNSQINFTCQKMVKKLVVKFCSIAPLYLSNTEQ